MDSDATLRTYLLDKGATDLADRNLLEVLKELLRKENRGIRSDRVEECVYVSVETLTLGKVGIGNLDHFASIESRELTSPRGNLLVTGIVVRDSKGDRIVDGYHRLKHSLERGLLAGTFIVISAQEI